MIRDTCTVMWREWREHVLLDGGWISLSSLAVFLVLVGVLLPWQVGEAWIHGSWMVVFWAWMPLFLATVLTADSVAGERERHTLETLLATRLPVRALLFGKVGASVGWVWSALLVCLPVGLLVVNLTHAEGAPVLYPAPLALATAAVMFLASLLGAALAVLVSMRTSTVRQAQQVLCVVVLALFLVPILLLRILPAPWVGDVLAVALSSPPERVALALGGVFLLLDLVLLAVAVTRFRRHALIRS